MRNRQTRRVNLSLHLSPEHSRADLRAMLQLKQWHQTLQQGEGDVNDANMEVRRFHRNVYLAGLQLHLLKPQLCSHIAESLGRETLTLDDLCEELQHDGLLPAEIEKSSPVAPEQFSKQQLEQMRELLAQTQPQQPAKAADPSSSEETAKLRHEVAELKTLLEQQHLLLQQLRVSGKTAAAEPVRGGQAEEVSLSEVDAPMQKMNKVRQKGLF
ncbi:hypothetical protein EGM70_01395 [Enterobacteriaceae bacterium 89]|nr:hypothetical protein [Enterobacteriaceae bacterium 89]